MTMPGGHAVDGFAISPANSQNLGPRNDPHYDVEARSDRRRLPRRRTGHRNGRRRPRERCRSRLSSGECSLQRKRHEHGDLRAERHAETNVEFVNIGPSRLFMATGADELAELTPPDDYILIPKDMACRPWLERRAS